MLNWSSEQYLKFGSERTQPSIDLVGRLGIADPKKILDIGCGPGNSTAVLRERYSSATILGIDNSQQMINSAKAKYSNIDFCLCNAGTELDKMQSDYDIVFSNACIQWIPEHDRLIADMLSHVKAGGLLAVQVPITENSPMYNIIGELMHTDMWRGRFLQDDFFYTLDISQYYDILRGLTGSFQMWETRYCHFINDYADIIEWYRGASLRPYLSGMTEDERQQFEADILSRLPEYYPRQADGKIILSFRRLFFTAHRE